MLCSLPLALLNSSHAVVVFSLCGTNSTILSLPVLVLVIDGVRNPLFPLCKMFLASSFHSGWRVMLASFEAVLNCRMSSYFEARWYSWFLMLLCFHVCFPLQQVLTLDVPFVFLSFQEVLVYGMNKSMLRLFLLFRGCSNVKKKSLYPSKIKVLVCLFPFVSCIVFMPTFCKQPRTVLRTIPSFGSYFCCWCFLFVCCFLFCCSCFCLVVLGGLLGGCCCCFLLFLFVLYLFLFLSGSSSSCPYFV